MRLLLCVCAAAVILEKGEPAWAAEEDKEDDALLKEMAGDDKKEKGELSGLQKNDKEIMSHVHQMEKGTKIDKHNDGFKDKEFPEQIGVIKSEASLPVPSSLLQSGDLDDAYADEDDEDALVSTPDDAPAPSMASMNMENDKARWNADFDKVTEDGKFFQKKNHGQQALDESSFLQTSESPFHTIHFVDVEAKEAAAKAEIVAKLNAMEEAQKTRGENHDESTFQRQLAEMKHSAGSAGASSLLQKGDGDHWVNQLSADFKRVEQRGEERVEKFQEEIKDGDASTNETPQLATSLLEKGSPDSFADLDAKLKQLEEKEKSELTKMKASAPSSLLQEEPKHEFKMKPAKHKYIAGAFDAHMKNEEKKFVDTVHEMESTGKERHEKAQKFINRFKNDAKEEEDSMASSFIEKGSPDSFADLDAKLKQLEAKTKLELTKLTANAAPSSLIELPPRSTHFLDDQGAKINALSQRLGNNGAVSQGSLEASLSAWRSQDKKLREEIN